MANITAAMVKELREASGAGMMECKKALTEADGNMEAAMDILKKSGAAKVEKKASRIAAEGIARVASEGNTAVVLEVNSETDFVAKNAVFQEFVQEMANKALKASVDKAGDGEDLVSILGVKADLDDATLKIGEKLSLRRFEKVTGDVVASYIHGGGKIGVLVAGEGASDDAAKEAQGMLEMKINQLKETINAAKIIDTTKLNTDTVQILTKVEIRNVKNNMKMAYTIVSESEANLRQGKISVNTPIAQGLLGKKIGDVVNIKIPQGTISLEILNISF